MPFFRVRGLIWKVSFSMQTVDGPKDYLTVNLRWWGYPSMHNLMGFDQSPGTIFVEQKSSRSKLLFLLTLGHI